MINQKPWCKLDSAAQCDCEDGVCHGARHENINRYYKDLMDYGFDAHDELDALSDDRTRLAP